MIDCVISSFHDQSFFHAFWNFARSLKEKSFEKVCLGYVTFSQVTSQVSLLSQGSLPFFFRSQFKMSLIILKPKLCKLLSTAKPIRTFLIKPVSTSSGPWMGVTQAAGSGSDEQARFQAALEKYSAYQPTPVSIQHFINFAQNATHETSFAFLKKELPVRLANIMKELQLLPHQLHETHACKVKIKSLKNDLSCSYI